MTLASSSKRLHVRELCTARRIVSTLSLPLLKFVRVRAPPPCIRLVAPRTASCTRVAPVPPDTNGPPSWSLTTSTVSSTKRLPSLLHPGHGHEVRYVSVTARLGHGPKTNPSGHHCHIPASRFTPLEEFPRRQPYRITAAFALLILPLASPSAHRSRDARTLQTSAQPSPQTLVAQHLQQLTLPKQNEPFTHHKGGQPLCHEQLERPDQAPHPVPRDGIDAKERSLVLPHRATRSDLLIAPKHGETRMNARLTVRNTRA